MALEPSETTFWQKAGSAAKSKKGQLAASGTGLSAAALIFLYTNFATRADLQRATNAQATQWQQINDLKTEVLVLKGRNSAYEMLLRYVSSNRIVLEDSVTNNAAWTPH